MKRDTDLEQPQDSLKDRLRQKSEKQLAMIEGLINDLLPITDATHLTAKERFDLLTRLISLYQHGIAVADSLETNQKGKRQNLAFTAIIQRLSPETDQEKEQKQNFRFIDVDTAIDPEIDEDPGFDEDMENY